MLLTHWHGDHTGGVPDLIRLYPHLASSIYKNDAGKGQLLIDDGQVFSVEGATVNPVHSSGHAHDHDHMYYMLKEENALFIGDNFLEHGSSAVEDLGLYMKTLRIMQVQGCAIGYPAHGAVITDLRGKIKHEIDQKLRRERQLLRKMQRFRSEDKGGKGSATLGACRQSIKGSSAG